MRRVCLEDLVSLSIEVLCSLGLSREDSIEVADTIRYANGHGVPTHGAGRLPLYARNIENGSIDPHARPEIVMDEAGLGVIDGRNALGQIVAKASMDLALEKVKSHGVALVVARNSNNFGTAGYYGAKAAAEGCGAIIMANASPAMAPSGGKVPLLGTNPICMAMPGANGIPPVVLDMATTVVARTRIRSAAKEGRPIPSEWALDKDGQPTTNPNDALEGSLRSVGDYKGYGLALFVDMFAGILSRGSFAGEVLPLSDCGAPSSNCHFFLLFDVYRFVDAEDYPSMLKKIVDAVKESGASARMPGERGFLAAEQSSGKGGTVELGDKQFTEINELAISLGIVPISEVEC